MTAVLETQLGVFAEKIRHRVSNNDKVLTGLTECSIFLKDPKKDSYILRASTTGSNYLGNARLNTNDTNREKFKKEDYENIGITVYSLFTEQYYISDDIHNDEKFSCYKLPNKDMKKWENSNFCELKSTLILSILVYPFKTTFGDEKGCDGVIRVVRKKARGAKKFTITEVKKLKRLVGSQAPWIKSSIFLSQLIEIGSYSDIPHLCEQAAFALKDLLGGKGCTIFLLDENESNKKTLTYKPYGTTGLVRKLTKLKHTKYFQISEPIKEPLAWYQYDIDLDQPNEGGKIPQLALTKGVIRARMPAFVDNLADEKQILGQFPHDYKIRRKPGHGQVCEFYLDEIEGKYRQTESILYAPMFYGDQNNKYSPVMGVVRIVRPEGKIEEGKIKTENTAGKNRRSEKSKGFSVQDKHLFVSIVERLSEAISSANFLRGLFKLSEIKEYKSFFKETVQIISKYIGGDDCALLLENNDKLYKFAEWRDGSSEFFDKDPNPYDLSDKGQWGYTGHVYHKKKLLMFNDPSDTEYHFSEDPPKHRKKSGKTPRRFIGIPIRRAEEGNKVIGVLRICKRDVSRKITDNDRRMLELIVKSIRRRTEEFIQTLHAVKEREKIFSQMLQKKVLQLENTSELPAKYLAEFFVESRPNHHIEFEILDLFVNLWKYYEPEYDFDSKMFSDFDLFNKNILTEIPHYRDHFIHQFAVYLVGLIIIDKLDTFFIDTFLNAYKYTSISPKDGLKKDFNVEERRQQREFVEFSWLKTALFHDIAYPVQSVETWVYNILKKYLKGYRLGFKYRLPLGEIFFDPGYLDLIDDLVDFHVNTLKRDDNGLREQLVDLLYNEENKPDHGIVSALLLIGENQFDRNDILPCASAIALHNNLMTKKNVDAIIFERHPLAFLLVYCDILHEWGREILAEKKKYPDLIDLCVQLNTGGIFPKPVGNKIFDRLNVDSKKKALIYSNIKLYEDSERKEKEFHSCFKNMKSNLIDFYTVVNRKVFP